MKPFKLVERGMREIIKKLHKVGRAWLVLLDDGTEATIGEWDKPEVGDRVKVYWDEKHNKIKATKGLTA